MSRQVSRTQARMGSTLVLVLACASVAMAQTPRERVFTANQGAGTVTAFDTDKGATAYTVVGLTTPTEIALNPQLQYGYVTEQLFAEVAAFDVHAPGGPAARIATTILDPFGICVSPDGRRGYVGNAERIAGGAGPFTDFISVFDTRTNLEIATVDISPLGTGPWEVAISPDGALLYVSCTGTRNVVIVDTATLTLVGQVLLPIAATQTPFRLVVAPDNSFVYVACPDLNAVPVPGSVVFFDPPTLTTGTVALLAAATAQPVDVFLTPDSTILYVVDPGNNVVQVCTATVPQTAFTFLIFTAAPTALARGTTNEDGTLGYLSDNGAGGDQFRVASNFVNRTFATGANPVGIAVKAIPVAGLTLAAAVQRERNRTESKQKGLCFIAAASYGDTDEVAALRAFRDLYLMPTKFGASFVDLYYESSPGVANLISTREEVRASVRGGLAPLILMARLVMGAGTVVPGGLAAVLVLAATLAAGRRLLRRKAA